MTDITYLEFGVVLAGDQIFALGLFRHLPE